MDKMKIKSFIFKGKSCELFLVIPSFEGETGICGIEIESFYMVSAPRFDEESNKTYYTIMFDKSNTAYDNVLGYNCVTSAFLRKCEKLVAKEEHGFQRLNIYTHEQAHGLEKWAV